MPEVLTFKDVRPHSQAEQDQDEAFNAHQTLGTPYVRCKPRESELTLLGILRDLFERLERPVTESHFFIDTVPGEPKRRKRRKRQNQPKLGIQIDWSVLPEEYRVSREAIETLFKNVRPSPPEYGREERRLAINEVPFEFTNPIREGWLLVAFTIRQPRKTKVIRPLSARYVNVMWLNANKLNTPMLKRLPPLYTNQEAKHFVDTVDLTEYDMSGFKPTEFERKGR